MEALADAGACKGMSLDAGRARSFIQEKFNALISRRAIMWLFGTLPGRPVKCLFCQKNVAFMKYLMEHYIHNGAICQSPKDLAVLCTLPGFPEGPFILALVRKKLFEIDMCLQEYVSS